MRTINDTDDRRPGVLAVHSLDRFAFSVPKLADARHFFEAFGLDVRQSQARLDLHTFDHSHCWGSVHEFGKKKQLQYLSFGIFPDNESAFRARIEELGLGCPPHPLSRAVEDDHGIWLKDPDGLPVCLVVAPKSSPAVKSSPIVPGPVAPGKGAAPSRNAAAFVRPRRLSHVLRFSPDVPRVAGFYTDVLGIRLSDHSGDGIAFMHGAHGSDHHLMAFVESEAPGLHHTSWDVGNVDEIGRGSEQMRSAGFTTGWGLGRHVLGSNYFYYVRDPWGSWAEYSYDIDFIPAELDWIAGDHPAQDSFYVWGPEVPEDFVTNTEAPSM